MKKVSSERRRERKVRYADKNRMAAFSALLKLETEDAFSNIALNEAVREYMPDDEAFVRNLVYGVTENRIYLDYRLSVLIKTGLKRVKPKAAVILLMGACQLEFMNSVPDYAAIDESVKMAKCIIPPLAGFVNGTLRSFVKDPRPALPEDPLERLGVRYSCSSDIVSMWTDMFGTERTESLLSVCNEEPPLTVHINTLKTACGELKRRLEDIGFTVSEPEFPDGYRDSLRGRVLKIRGSGLTSCGEFKKGLFYIQDISSMAAVYELAPKRGDTVIDLCSAPGGKSFLAAELMENEGRIIACDVHEHRLKLEEDTSERLGIDIIETVQMDGTVYNDSFSELADCVIADVPCSGLGVIRRRPEIKLRMDTDTIKKLADIQLKILNNAVRYLKRGGRLIYSTCTISKYENEQNLKSFAQKNLDCILLNQKQFMPDTDNTDGFYFSVFQRI